MASFAGLRGTGSFAATERPTNFREMVLWSNPNGQAPLTALLAKTAKEDVDDPEFAWYEEALSHVRLQTNGTIASGVTTLVVTGGALALVAGDVLQVEKTETSTYDNELVEVSAVTNDTTVLIKRGAANSTPAQITNLDYLTKISNVFAEASNGPAVANRNPTKLSNYCQIFKTGVGISNTAKKTKYRTGDPWKNDKKRKSFDHSVALEYAFLFGRKYEDLTGTFPKRYTGGLRSFLTTNVKIFASTPTEDTFLDALFPVFNYNTSSAGDERIVLAGNGFLNSMNKLARNSSSTQIMFDSTLTKVYGMNLQRWTTPQGTFGVKTHPLMNIHPRYTYSAFIIDPTGLKYRAFRDTFFKDNTQANDKDSQEGYWLTEAGLEVQHEETMGYIGNFVV